MDFKENQRCIAEKDTSFGVLHMFQKRPKYSFLLNRLDIPYIRTFDSFEPAQAAWSATKNARAHWIFPMHSRISLFLKSADKPPFFRGLC